MNCNKKFNDYNSYFKSKRVESEICRFINDYSVINGGTINGDLTINGDTVMNGDLEISGNIEINGNLDMSCNLINDVSGINFCDGTYIGHGDSFDISTNEVLHLKTSQNIVIDGDTKFNNNVSIVGNLNIQGTTTSISTQDLIVNDNIIFINQTMDSCGNPTQDVLPDPSNIISGFSVYRGPILPGDIVRDEYQFVYDESSNSFRIGISGETQPVATREDLPTENGVAVWDVSTNKFITNKGLTMDNGGVFKIDNSLNKVLSQVQTLNGTIFTGSSNNTRFGDISNNLIFSLGGKGMAIGTFNAGENLIFGVDNTEIMRIDGSSYDVIISGGDLDMCCNLINDVSGINFCGGSVINNAGMDISGLTTLDNLDVTGVTSINNLEVSGNVVIRNGDLDMCCNLINDVSGINFCDGTYIGHGSSFDISTNEVLHISTSQNIIIDGDVSFNNNIEISGNIVAKNLTEKNNDTNVHYNTSTGEITYSKNKLDLFNFSGFQRERINITDITGL